MNTELYDLVDFSNFSKGQVEQICNLLYVLLSKRQEEPKVVTQTYAFQPQANPYIPPTYVPVSIPGQTTPEPFKFPEGTITCEAKS